MPLMPYKFQIEALSKIGARLARESGVDPVYASQALDFLDSTLSYEENKRIYFEELERRGIRTVPVEAKAKADFELYLGEVLFREVPGLEEYIGEIRTEAAVAETELGKLKERHTKLREETKRWKELSEAERARLTSELDEIKRGLEALLGGLPRPWVEELMVVFIKLPKATEEAFWSWLKENLDLAKRQYEAKVLAASLEPHMKEWLEKKPAPPPKPVVVRLEPKYKIGDEAFDLETGRKIIVRQQLYNELTKKWDYLVDDRGKIKRISEDRIVPLPPLPPPAERPPRAPAPPRAPPTPKTLEEIAVCPFDPAHHVLERYEGPIEIMVPKEVLLPMEERWRRKEAGLPETELRWVTERVPIPEGFIFYHDIHDEIIDKTTTPPTVIRPKCPGFCRYYEVRDMRLYHMTYDEVVERIRRAVVRITRPIIPTPTVTTAPLGQVMREVQEYTRGVESDPEFRKYVETEVGLTWEAYLKQDPWTKKAIREEFIKRETKVR